MSNRQRIKRRVRRDGRRGPIVPSAATTRATAGVTGTVAVSAATAAGGAVTAVGARAADAAPRTCVTCICGTGRPCNPKSTACTEVRAFPAEQACAEACARQNQNLCGLGNTFHCPKGCQA